MSEEELQLLKDVINQIGNNGSYIISQYANWYFVNAIVWLCFGLLMLALSLVVYKMIEDTFLKVCGGVFVVISIMIVISNITNIIAPESYAIHSLINDLKSKN